MLAFCAVIYAIGVAVTNSPNPTAEVLGLSISGFRWATAGGLIGVCLALATPVMPLTPSASDGAHHLIKNYAAILATDEEGAVRSASELPAPKATLDRLLREAIQGARDLAALDAYGAGFVGLGLFQPDVSAEDRNLEDQMASLRHRIRSSGREVRQGLLESHAKLAKRLTVWREIVDAELAERKHALDQMLERHPLVTGNSFPCASA